jgi:DNA repair protein RecO (recombination protein O)
MIVSSRAVVLHQLKYAETSLIVTLYTEAEGRQSYMINGIRSVRSKQKTGFFQPLFLLEIEAYHKPGREIQRMKEFRILEAYRSIPFQIVKSSMAMFLSEVLYRVLRSEESDPNLFEFLIHSFGFFDSMQHGQANFHLWFLANLSGFLGFKPENNYNVINPWFDPKKGSFTAFKPHYPNSPDKSESETIANLFSLEIGHLSEFNPGGVSRMRMLEILIDYYAVHFEGIGKIHSLQILNEVFHH